MAWYENPQEFVIVMLFLITSAYLIIHFINRIR